MIIFLKIRIEKVTIKPVTNDVIPNFAMRLSFDAWMNIEDIIKSFKKGKRFINRKNVINMLEKR